MKIHIIIPTQKLDGGNKEIQNIIKSIDGKLDFTQVSMWKAKDEINKKNLINLSNIVPSKKTAIPSMPFIFFSLIKYSKENIKNDDIVLLTHYSTFIFLMIERKNIAFFVQGLEWFLIRSFFIRAILKKIILHAYKKGRIISANKYIENELLSFGIKTDFNVSIWANESFLSKDIVPTIERKIDFVMMLRNGSGKRLDLYDKFISLAIRNGMTISFITQEPDIFAIYENLALNPLLKATPSQMKNLYENSKFFIHLSDHEGFGLPPLEAMGSGCIPFCRDSKGVNAYMQEGLSENVFSLDTKIDYIFAYISQLQEKNLTEMQTKCLSIFTLGLSKKGNIADFFYELEKK